MEFVDYATAVAPRLRGFAYLLCHDWHFAQDLTQTTLAKSYVSWPRVRAAEDPAAYGRHILLRVFLDHRRRRSSSELLIAEMPQSGREEQHDLRITLFDALSRLPPRDRAIVVLRYWEDHSVNTTAEMLNLPVATVKKQAVRSLVKLRGLLQDERVGLFAGQG